MIAAMATTPELLVPALAGLLLATAVWLRTVLPAAPEFEEAAALAVIGHGVM